MKHVQENLFQFREHKFFQLFEEEDAEIKQMAQEQETVGNSVVDKAKENFSRFEKDAKGLVIKYKEFWEENKSMKANFDEGAKIYKMFDSPYVIGMMTLPDEALDPAAIDKDLDDAMVDDAEGDFEDSEKEEDTKEPKEDEKEEDDKEDDKKPAFMKEGFEPPKEEENNDDLGFEQPASEPAPDAAAPADPMASPAPAVKQPEVEEHPIDAEEEVMDTPGEPKMSLVVYRMGDEDREEIFRCSNNAVMHAFEDFFENTFKGSMKAIIAKVREKQETIKKDMEVKAKEEELQNKKAKVKQFLKE